MKGIWTILIATSLSAGAEAVFFDFEPNNSRATAQALFRPSGIFSDVGLFALTGQGDIDVVKVSLSAGETFTAVTTPTQGNQFLNPDTVMALLDSFGTPLVQDDDSGPGLGSLIQFNAFLTGDYYLAITGFDDPLFTGSSLVQGNYTLTVSAVPEPTTVAGLGLAMAWWARRRRASSKV